MITAVTTTTVSDHNRNMNSKTFTFTPLGVSMKSKTTGTNKPHQTQTKAFTRCVSNISHYLHLQSCKEMLFFNLYLVQTASTT